MYLKRALSINVAILACIATFLLGLGHGDGALPVWMFLAAVASIWLTDILGWIRLSHRMANVVILVIVVVLFGGIFRSQHGAALAMAIVRILVFMQIVLLFRDKDKRCYWHLIVLSFLQVVVATSFDQGASFGLLLIAYVFTAMSAMTLLFMYSEALYFKTHSTVTGNYGLSSSFDPRRENWLRILKIAIATFVIGPISLFLQQESSEDADDEETPEINWIPWRKKKEITAGRWPLLHEKPTFEGASLAGSGYAGVNFALWKQLIKITCQAVALALVVFIFTPRFNEIRIGSWVLPNDQWGQSGGPGGSAMTGYSENFQIGQIGALQQNPEEAFRLELIDPRTGKEYQVAGDLHLRGTVRTAYKEGWAGAEIETDGRWETGGPWPPRPRTREGEYGERGSDPRSRPLPQSDVAEAMGADDVRLKLHLQPLNIDTLFCTWPSFKVDPLRDGPERVPDVKMLRSRGNRNRECVEELGTAAFRRGVQLEVIPAEVEVDREELLDLNRDDLETLCATAEQWIEEAKIPKDDPVAVAKHLERKLAFSDRFKYSLQGRPPMIAGDPFEDFVKHHPFGHCEYFAHTLALMLRSQGIPARVVVGFRGGMYNPLGHFYLFRQLDAHTWVQAYIPPDGLDMVKSQDIDAGAFAWRHGGWLRLDPTPGGDGTMLTDFAESVDSWTGWIKFAWENYIIKMNGARQQQTIYEPATAMMGDVRVVFTREWWANLWGSSKQFVRDTAAMFQRGDWFNARGGALAALLSGLAYFMFRLSRFLYRLYERWTDPDVEGSRHSRYIRVEFYRRLEHVLQRYGLERRPEQTQREFADKAAEALIATDGQDGDQLARLPREVVDAFYVVRFGGKRLTREEMKTVESALRELQRHDPAKSAG